MNSMNTLKAFSLAVAVLGTTGCAGLDRVGTKLDMSVQRLGTAKPTYEGQLRSVKRVGAMTSLQFTDGKIMDVSKAPAALLSGDVVRVYKTDDIYVAHLWRSAETMANAEANTLAPLIPTSK